MKHAINFLESFVIFFILGLLPALVFSFVGLEWFIDWWYVRALISGSLFLAAWFVIDEAGV